MKNADVVKKILEYHPCIEKYQGCDEWKCGDPEQECMGIAVALVPTVEVIQQAIEKRCNLLVTHEPIFYQTPDYPEWKGSFDNSVYEEKKRLLEESGLAVWRDHDHMHTHQPDSIFTGVLKYLEWDNYCIPSKKLPPFSYMVELPTPMKVKELNQHLMSRIGMNGMRYMGRDEDEIKRILITAHLYPNESGADGIKADGFYHDYAMELMQAMEEQDIEALIPGEIVEWTILAYIRDAIALGKTKACFNIGHFCLEELGMKYAKDWIKELVTDAVDVHYIPTKDAFGYCSNNRERGGK